MARVGQVPPNDVIAVVVEGIVSRGHLICPQHAWRFSTATGRHPEASQYCLVMYPVRVVGDHIEVDPRPLGSP